MPAGELTPYQLHGMHPVLAVRDVAKAVNYYRDMLGFHVDFVHGDPPLHARVCADPSYSSPTVHIRFEPLDAAATPNPSVYLWVHVGTGLDRLFHALDWGSGRFELTEDEVSVVDSVQLPTTFALMEHARRKDELAR